MLYLSLLHSTHNYKHMEFKERIKEARVKKGLSQSQLSKAIGVHVTNISRYERGENRPTSDVLTKLANELDVTADFLMDGSMDDKAQSSISDKELLSQFQKVSLLSNDRKAIVKELLEAFLLKSDLQQRFVQ
jgi:transcriptional regulator with XRE-family HTH domain